jgi:phospholipid transport system substrate-binding protein
MGRQMTVIGRAVTAAAMLAVSVLWAAPGWSGPPTDTVRTRVEQVIRVLEDPALKPAGRQAERRAAIRRVAWDLFDFEETARRCLGRHWQGRTPAERAEFVTLFADLLERTYIGRIEQYSGEQIAYAGETVDGEQATVRTRLAVKGTGEVPMDYRMLRRDGRWRVYDVIIEGVSLVGNYRAQFNRIIQTSSYGDLVQRLRARIDEGDPPGAAPSR